MSSQPKLLSSIIYASFFAYSPRGTSEVAKKSRNVRDAIKYDRPNIIAKAVQEVLKKKDLNPLKDFFPADAVLVPAPGHTPLVPNALWVPKRISDTLVEAGIGQKTLVALERKEPVAKSAFSSPGKRPTCEEHLSTMELTTVAKDTNLFPPPNIIVIDDFVTKGATLLAAVSLLKHTFPSSDVKGFALIKTMGLISDIEHIIDPCVSIIIFDGSDVHRSD